jgi:hypothetical protein
VFSFPTQSKYREGDDSAIVIKADSIVSSGQVVAPNAEYVVFTSDYKVLREECAGLEKGDVIAIVHLGMQKSGERTFRKFSIKTQKCVD